MEPIKQVVAVQTIIQSYKSAVDSYSLTRLEPGLLNKINNLVNSIIHLDVATNLNDLKLRYQHLKRIKSELKIIKEEIDDKIEQVSLPKFLLNLPSHNHNQQVLENAKLVLKQLEDDLENLQLESAAFSYFIKEGSIKSRIKEKLKVFSPSPLNKIKVQVRSQIFLGWKKLDQEKEKRLSREFEEADKEYEALRPYQAHLEKDHLVVEESWKKALVRKEGARKSLLQIPEAREAFLLHPLYDEYLNAQNTSDQIQKTILLFNKQIQDIEDQLSEIDQKENQRGMVLIGKEDKGMLLIERKRALENQKEDSFVYWVEIDEKANTIKERINSDIEQTWENNPAMQRHPKYLEYKEAQTQYKAANVKEEQINKRMAWIEVTVEKRRQIQQELDQLKSKTESNFLKRADIRKRFQDFGGERVKIEDVKSHCVLDGMYLSADKFRERLDAMDVKIGQMIIKAQGRNKMIQGFLVSNQDIAAKLNKLGFEECGYKSCNYGNDIFLCPDEESSAFEDAVKQGNVQQADKFPINSSRPSEGGIVLLTQGNSGIYESSKREILAFLLRGMNVMVANFAGYGDSTGVPTGKVLRNNMDAIYAYLQDNHPIAEDKVLIKGLCMSGGPAAYLAAKHPQVHLFLDQTYADFRDLVANTMIEGINKIAVKHKDDKKLKYQLLKWGHKKVEILAHLATKMVAPAWVTKKEIAKVKGHIAILQSSQDKLINVDRDINKNFQAALKAGNQNVTLMEIEGEHGAFWLDSKNAKGLKEIGIVIPSEEIAKQKIEEFTKDNEERIKRIFSSSTEKPDVLNQIWKQLTSEIEKRQIKTLNDFNDFVEREEQFYKMVASHLPVDEINQLIRDFLTILCVYDVNQLRENPDEIQVEFVYKGRQQVDKYLTEAYLNDRDFFKP
jgi:hypothetical protein